ncbi:NADP-dependent oxidoreductase [Phytohabitans aurantiacus]|jgi:NADPH-dependent curcumin reductase CurA|uniref:NADP-dependent oxidoreductase n=1 Tax=Phytohabitans aurantiacus TaxID=3016789 RepID=A0ABQ5R6L4_9ACTN|nr:NADP-dependent oxidoreductase [Phytohabitans aurantiacus]GLI02399.1 NADP-dependent oxidoreductase [Phytohabitans aurantiacus]
MSAGAAAGRLIGREVRLASRPSGWPVAENFQIVEAPVPSPGPGHVIVRNIAMSVDPYMRGRMNDVKSYVPPFALDAPLDGGAVGEVIVSESPDRKVGDLVVHGLGWRDYAVLDASRTKVIDPGLAPPTAYLGALGMTGLTAYAGLVEVGAMRPGDTVFISSAAGAVGSLAGQIAKLRGAARVVGSAGSAAKVAYARELGFDAAFDYHDGPVGDSLREAAPDGIDVYFDNVGGDHLEAALSSLRPHGRVAMCGAVAQYNNTTPPAAPRNLALAIGKQLTLKGFIVSSYGHLADEFAAQMAEWLRDGKVRFDETTVDGLENSVRAFLGMLRGDNVGKMVVRLS